MEKREIDYIPLIPTNQKLPKLAQLGRLTPSIPSKAISPPYFSKGHVGICAIGSTRKNQLALKRPQVLNNSAGGITLVADEFHLSQWSSNITSGPPYSLETLVEAFFKVFCKLLYLSSSNRKGGQA
jgi:hypothetical protein